MGRGSCGRGYRPLAESPSALSSPPRCPLPRFLHLGRPAISSSGPGISFLPPQCCRWEMARPVAQLTVLSGPGVGARAPPGSGSLLCFFKYLQLRRLYQRVDLSPDRHTSARLIWAPPCWGREKCECQQGLSGCSGNSAPGKGMENTTPGEPEASWEEERASR